MKCQVCNAEAAQGASFCQHCGAKLAAFDSAAQPLMDDPAAGTRRSPNAEVDTVTSAEPVSDRSRMPRDVAEQVLWEGSYSPKAMLGTAIGCGLLSLALLVGVFFVSGIWIWLLLLAVVLIWVAAGLQLAIRRLGISYKLTNQMFYHRRGVFTRVIDRIELIEIHDVTWVQNLIERTVDVGKIIVKSSDETHKEFTLLGIEGVERVASIIDKARRGEQVRRGRRIDFSNVDEAGSHHDHHGH
jgi:hypothetical protein